MEASLAWVVQAAASLVCIGRTNVLASVRVGVVGDADELDDIIFSRCVF